LRTPATDVPECDALPAIRGRLSDRLLQARLLSMPPADPYASQDEKDHSADNRKHSGSESDWIVRTRAARNSYPNEKQPAQHGGQDCSCLQLPVVLLAPAVNDSRLLVLAVSGGFHSRSVDAGPLFVPCPSRAAVGHSAGVWG